MEMIKKNIGFVVISLICFLLIGFFVMKCRNTNEKLIVSKGEYEKMLNYLDGVGKKKIKLTDENLKIAKQNSSITTDGINRVHKTLMERFKIKYNVPIDSASALRELKDAIHQMQVQLEENGVKYNPNLEYFSFGGIARSATLPLKDDLPYIFRQLTIVQEVVKVAIDSKVITINDIRRPLNLKVHEEGDYTVTPIEVTVTATLENGQAFVNAMSNQENFLFILRTIEIKAPDVTSSVVKGLGTTEDTSGIDVDVEGVDKSSKTGRRGPNSQRPGSDRKDGLVDIPVKRQELLVFDKKYSAWKLRFDLIEPKYEIPEEKKAEE